MKKYRDPRPVFEVQIARIMSSPSKLSIGMVMVSDPVTVQGLFADVALFRIIKQLLLLL
jgi:hypothetical protein